MATVTVRNLDDGTQERLKARAKTHGRSMEAEAREILTDAVTAPSVAGGLGSRIAALFANVEGDDLPVVRSGEVARAAAFGS